jgi:hypothetical protein
VSPREVQTQLRRLRSEARALALPYSSDEREALALLFLPFLLVASAVVVHQSVRTLHSYITAVTAPEFEIAPVRPDATAGLPLSALPRSVARDVRPNIPLLKPVADASEVGPIRNTGLAIEAAALEGAATAIATPEAVSSPTTAESELASIPAPALEQTEVPKTTLALLLPVQDLTRSARAVAPPPLEAYEADGNGNPIFAGICSVDEKRSLASATPAASPATELMTLTADAFGLRLAAAAESQVGQFVIYNDAYRSISYPMGDVPNLFGVCTDVIVRAYRALGLDLQTLVHEARSGRGDPNIDHRRTEVLRRFFAAHGETIPITSFAEDYRPGDIVTYHRPQNRGARAHIAMVSSVIAPSGRPMIVHNRGWGPQLEDALFVDQITGHYRYRGPSAIRNAAHEKGLSGKTLEARASISPAGTTMQAPRVVPVSLRAHPAETAEPAGQH